MEDREYDDFIVTPYIFSDDWPDNLEKLKKRTLKIESKKNVSDMLHVNGLGLEIGSTPKV